MKRCFQFDESHSTRRARRRLRLLFAGLLLCHSSALFAADEPKVKADEPKVKVETVIGELSDPCGLAIQPGTDDIFISDTGAGRIVKVARMKPQQAVSVIVGFPHESAAKQEPTKCIGTAGLAFLNEHTLVVGSSSKIGDRSLRVYSLPAAESGEELKPIDFDAAKQKLNGTAEGEAAVSGEGKFYGLAVSPFNPPSLCMTNPGSSRGWIFKAEIKNWSTLEVPKPCTFVPQKYIAQFGLPSGGITINRRGLLVAGMKHADAAKGSSLGFFVVKKDAGGLITALPTTLHEIDGLAYSPESGRLYAADFSSPDPQAAGIYRLDSAMIEGQSGIKAIKVAAVAGPSAIAFTTDNTMYVTVFGAPEEDANKAAGNKRGKLMKITGDL